MTQQNPAENIPSEENREDAVLPPEAAAQIAELERELANASDRMLRALAEADNTRKRLEKERLDTAKFAITGFARDMLPVADNLRRALDAITPEQRENNPELKNIYIGVEATERELLRVFEQNHIRKVDPLHQTFDPNRHEVIFESPAPGKPAGTVIQVVEPGYMLHERLLRPARVGIAKGGETENGARVDAEV